MLGYLTVFWGFTFYLIAVALRGFPPLTLVLLRLAIGAAALYPLMRWRGGRLPRELHWWRRFGLLSLLGNLIPFSLISWSEMHISSGQAGLLMALMPISTVLLAHLFVVHEQLTRRRMLGVVLGFAGVTVLIGNDALRQLGGSQLLAQIAVIAATLSYAVNAVYTKRLPQIDTLVVATGSLVVGALMLAPVALLVERPWQLAPGLDAWLAVIALGIFATGLATWVYFRVVSDCGPGFLSIINYMIPAVAFAAGVLFLSEPASWLQLVGLLVICAGIALSQPLVPRRHPGAVTD
ncbi:DMT family transporter [Halieaceae bacterium]|nr:DMT family transporter [Halieaceae bacterium]